MPVIDGREVLADGLSVSEVAKLTKNGTGTIHRWKRESALFIAALNEARAERHRRHVFEFESLWCQAVANVRAAVESGCLKSSLKLLEKAGLLAPKPIGETDLQVI